MQLAIIRRLEPILNKFKKNLIIENENSFALLFFNKYDVIENKMLNSDKDLKALVCEIYVTKNETDLTLKIIFTLCIYVNNINKYGGVNVFNIKSFLGDKSLIKISNTKPFFINIENENIAEYIEKFCDKHSEYMYTHNITNEYLMSIAKKQTYYEKIFPHMFFCETPFYDEI